LEADFKSIEDAMLWVYETLLTDEDRLQVKRPEPLERSEKPVPDEYFQSIPGPPEEFKMISLQKIQIDLDTQARVAISQKTIKEYIEAMRRGAVFPAILVFQIGDLEDYVLVDGFHRYYSYMEVDPTMLIPARIQKGTLKEARWASHAVNQQHGLQRSKSDKKKSITQVLQDEKGAKMSNRQIAEYLGVNESTVRRTRHQLEAGAAMPQSAERLGKDGRTINTEKIGKVIHNKSFSNKTLQQENGVTDGREDVITTVEAYEKNLVGEDDESVSTMTFTLPAYQAASHLAEHFFCYFGDKFVRDLVISAIAIMDEKVEPGAAQRLLDELNERFGKRQVSVSSPETP
jgi:hypothetical protein